MNPNTTMDCVMHCGRRVLTHTQVCKECRREYRIGDVEMFCASLRQPWLSRAWT